MRGYELLQYTDVHPAGMTQGVFGMCSMLVHIALVIDDQARPYFQLVCKVWQKAIKHGNVGFGIGGYGCHRFRENWTADSLSI